MRNKLLLYGLLFLLVSGAAFALSEVSKDWWNDLIDESRGGASLFGWNILSPLSDNNYVPGMFYPVEKWEVRICAQPLTSERQQHPEQYQYGASTDVKKIYATTATITAIKQTYPGTNTALYTINWYIQPKNQDQKYSVYLAKNAADTKPLYIPGYKDVVASAAHGDAGYFADYYEQNYTIAVIQYGSEKPLIATIVQKTN